MHAKTILVTGAARRLGADIARYFAARSFRVIVHARSASPRAIDVVESINRDGGHARLVVGDLTAEADRNRVLQEICDEAGALDILVNNASEFEYDFPGQGGLATLQKSLAIHVLAPFVLTEFFARRATSARKLDVFNILDQRLLRINPDYYSYTVGKAGLHAITKCWQAAGAENVRVFGILPGNMSPSGRQTEAEFEAARAANLLGYAPTAADICDALLFFHSNPSLPGQDLAIDAGEHLTDRARDPAFDPRFAPR